MSIQTVAVLSDIHSNALALRAALSNTAELGVDQVVILGDLLSYGVRVRETVEIVRDACESGAVLVAGNHDQLYRDIHGGVSTYLESLPPWIRESAQFTLENMSLDAFCELPWNEEYSWNRILFMHANPFGFGDWTYLNRPDDLDRARAELANRGMVGGVFGHNHRPHLDPVELSPWLANPGSVGQPRSRCRRATYLLIRNVTGRCQTEIVTVDYDIQTHVGDVYASGMSIDTCRRIAAFHEPSI